MGGWGNLADVRVNTMWCQYWNLCTLYIYIFFFLANWLNYFIKKKKKKKKKKKNPAQYELFLPKPLRRDIHLFERIDDPVCGPMNFKGRGGEGRGRRDQNQDKQNTSYCPTKITSKNGQGVPLNLWTPGGILKQPMINSPTSREAPF